MRSRFLAAAIVAAIATTTPAGDFITGGSPTDKVDLRARPGSIPPAKWVGASDLNDIKRHVEGWVAAASYLPAMYVTDGSVDYTAQLQNALNTGRRVMLPFGTFTVTGLTAVSGGGLFSYGGTTIKLAAGTGLKALTVGVPHFSVRGLFFDGGGAGPYNVVSAVAGTRYGIYALGAGVGSSGLYDVTIEDCAGTGFDHSALFLKNTAQAMGGDTGLAVVNVSRFNATTNYNGIFLDDLGEYVQIADSSSTYAYAAIRVVGGNNRVVNSHFSKSFRNALLRSGSNDSHGSFTNCDFNHMINGGVGIDAGFLTVGETFTGCQIWYSDILITDGRGVSFVNNEIGQSNITTAYSSGLNAGTHQFAHNWLYGTVNKTFDSRVKMRWHQNIGDGETGGGDYEASAMPAAGTYQAGDRVWNSAPSAGNPMGWFRITTGSAHVLNTDWRAMPNL